MSEVTKTPNNTKELRSFLLEQMLNSIANI